MHRPNILLILTDQTRLSAISSYGDTPCRTPNVDRIRDKGILFRNAYTSCPLCSPARASIMTGQFPHNHGITANVGDLGCMLGNLPDSPELLSRRLERAGYACGYSGKWHLGDHHERWRSNGYIAGDPALGGCTLPRDVGFQGQNFAGHGGGGFKYQEYRDYLAEHGWEHRPVQKDGYTFLDQPAEATVPYFLADHTIGLIDRMVTEAREKPFFMWHNFWGPHEPYLTTDECLDMYRDVAMPEWPSFRWPAEREPGPHAVKLTHSGADKPAWSHYEKLLRQYYGFMSLIDAQIGRIYDHLERNDLLRNTVVIFTADHGETLGSHGGLMDKGFHHFDEIQRIPFIVRMPDGSRAGEEMEEFVSLLDVYPTVLDYAGTSYNEAHADGRTIRPLLEGAKSGWRDQIVVEFNGVNGGLATLRTIRYRNFKYGFSLGWPEQLYDLDRDPDELHNLAEDAAFADVVRDMRSRLVNWMEETHDGAILLARGAMQRSDGMRRRQTTESRI
ncbi:MAG: DUF4976 domain-containing protein, partial [Spirochaetaceae bacterium]